MNPGAPHPGRGDVRQEAKIIPHPAVRRASEHLHPRTPMVQSPYSAVVLSQDP